MTIFGRPAHEYALSAFWVVASAAYVGIATTYPPAARALPVLVGSIVFILALVDLVAMTYTPIGQRLSTWINPNAAKQDIGAGTPSDASFGRRALALGCVGAFVLLMMLVGVTLAIAGYLTLSLCVLGDWSVPKAFLVGLCTAAFCYLLFAVALQVRLYEGVLLSLSGL